MQFISRVPLQFEKSLKNPCWHASNGDIFCLPYFYMIGMPKSGSTDLSDRIRQHPHVTGVGCFYWTPYIACE